MRLIIALFIFLGSTLADDWQDRRGDVSKLLKLASQMKHNCLTEQDEVKWKQQVAKVQAFGIDTGGADPLALNYIDQLVVDAESVFWSRPRQDCIDRLNSGDPDQIQYLIDNAGTRIYSSKGDYDRESVVEMLMMIVKGLR